MYDAKECRAQAERYGELAQRATLMRERDRFLRMQRAYALMARSADFDDALNELMEQLSGRKSAVPRKDAAGASRHGRIVAPGARTQSTAATGSRAPVSGALRSSKSNGMAASDRIIMSLKSST